MRTLHGSCPGTSVFGRAERLECVCFSTALEWERTEDGRSESGGQPPHSRRFATSEPN